MTLFIGLVPWWTPGVSKRTGRIPSEAFVAARRSSTGYTVRADIAVSAQVVVCYRVFHVEHSRYCADGAICGGQNTSHRCMHDPLRLA